MDNNEKGKQLVVSTSRKENASPIDLNKIDLESVHDLNIVKPLLNKSVAYKILSDADKKLLDDIFLADGATWIHMYFL